MTGQRAYRGHKPGTTFEATIDPPAETRAIQRGSVTVIERSTPTIRPGSFTLPADWQLTRSTVEERNV